MVHQTRDYDTSEEGSSMGVLHGSGVGVSYYFIVVLFSCSFWTLISLSHFAHHWLFNQRMLRVADNMFETTRKFYDPPADHIAHAKWLAALDSYSCTPYLAQWNLFWLPSIQIQFQKRIYSSYAVLTNFSKSNFSGVSWKFVKSSNRSASLFPPTPV